MPRTPSLVLILLTTALSVLTATGISAHEGHDHGLPPPMPVTATLSPRVTAESADFELVAVLDDGWLTVYLDDFATNRPIEDAALGIEGGAWRGSADHAGDGVYRLDAGPIAASYVDPKPPGARLDFDVRQKDFVALLYQLQESKYGVAGLPFVLNDLVKNGRASMAKGLGQILGPQLLQARMLRRVRWQR